MSSDFVYQFNYMWIGAKLRSREKKVTRLNQ